LLFLLLLLLSVVAHRFFIVKVHLVLKTCQRLSATPRQKVVIRKHIIAI
jgi:hypothetical protein